MAAEDTLLELFGDDEEEYVANDCTITCSTASQTTDETAKSKAEGAGKLHP